jgi:hypothetical protein
MSLSHNNLKMTQLSAEGLTVRPIMYPDVPNTQEGLDELRKNVYGSGMAYPAIVSLDSKKTIITVDFFEEDIDYKICYQEFKALREKYETNNNIIAISGEPMHLGYIDSYVGDVVKILIYTVITMMLVFLLYFRTKRGMLLPIFAAGVSAVWGFGFLSLMGYNLDPLVLVFPFIIATRAASHSVQIIKRYTEEAYHTGDVKQSCKSTIEHLFVPGFAGIVTDASGVVVIALCPIPILQKICLSCAFWAFATIAHAMILVPILLSYMPIRTSKKTEGFLDRALKNMGHWIVSWGKYPVMAISVALLIWGTFSLDDLTIGNAYFGSEVLWPWHRYNVDCMRITFGMPMLNPLYVVVEGDESLAMGNPTVVREICNFTRFMQRTEDMRVIFAMSVLTQLPRRNQTMHDNDLNWNFVSTYDRQLMLMYRNIIDYSGPGTWDRYIDNDDRKTNVIIYCRDRTAETIKIVVDRINEYIRTESLFGKRAQDVERHGFDKFIYWVDGFFREQPPPIPEKPPIEGVPTIHYRLAGGTVGVQAGINEALELYQLWTFLLALTTVFILCSISFQSVVAGLIVIFPLLLSDIVAFAFMVMQDPPLPLTTATLPVSAVGIGLGVDYGIYLISRIMEEYKNTGSLEGSITTALGTTGKAIVFVATTLVCGIGFWLTSKLMFQAMMGLLLAIILVFNMFGALFIIPSLISIIKPKFITRGK